MSPKKINRWILFQSYDRIAMEPVYILTRGNPSDIQHQFSSIGEAVEYAKANR